MRSYGTLFVSREVNNLNYYKKRLETLGFPDVTVTDRDKDALYSIIREKRPRLLMMSARFYHSCTPFVMGELKHKFKRLKLAAVCLGEYPAEIAMYFILNGIKSYVTSFDGFEQFYTGLDKVAKGGEYVSPAVAERIDLRREYPEPAGTITDRHKEVIRLICSGFKDMDIADTLSISRRTVDNHKTEIFTSLNVTSAVELFRAALTLEIIRLEELYFYPRNLAVNPKPDKELMRGSEKWL